MKQRGYTLIIYLVLALAILGSLAGLYALVDANWSTSAGVAEGKTLKQAEWDKKAREQRQGEEKQAAAAATTLETDNAKARTVYRTITQTVDRYIDRPVYKNICLDADGLASANAALTGALIESGSRSEGSPKKWPLRMEYRVASASE